MHYFSQRVTGTTLVIVCSSTEQPEPRLTLSVGDEVVCITLFVCMIWSEPL